MPSSSSQKKVENAKKDAQIGVNRTGPLSKHMEPVDFENMTIKQKNNSAHFNPKFKLKTDTLKKVLFRLKKEKEELDQNLEYASLKQTPRGDLKFRRNSLESCVEL